MKKLTAKSLLQEVREIKKQADKFEGLPSRDIMESLNNWLRIAKRKYGDSYAKINEAYMDKYRKSATYSGGVQNIGDWVRDPYAWEFDPDGDFLIMSESSANKIDKDFQSYMEKQHWWDPEQYYLNFSYSEKYWSDFEVRVFRK